MSEAIATGTKIQRYVIVAIIIGLVAITGVSLMAGGGSSKSSGGSSSSTPSVSTDSPW